MQCWWHCNMVALALSYCSMFDCFNQKLHNLAKWGCHSFHNIQMSVRGLTLGCGYYVTYVLRITHAAAPVAMLVIFHVGTWTNYQCVGCCLLPNVHMSRVIHIFTTSFQRRTGNVKISFLLQSDLYGKLVELGTLFRIWVPIKTSKCSINQNDILFWMQILIKQLSQVLFSSIKSMACRWTFFDNG